MNYCGMCATKLVDGGCPTCTAKSTNGLSMETLEKSLETLESLSKGVRPSEATGGEEQGGTSAKEHNKKAVDQAHKYGKKGEGDSEEQPKTKKNIESAAKGGFVPPGAEDEDEERDPREEEEEMMEQQQGQPEFKSAKGKKAKKSFADDAMDYDGVRKAVDVSPFLEGITAQIGETMDEVRSEVEKSLNFASYQKSYNIGLAKSLIELGNVVKSLAVTVSELSKSPSGQRKADTSAAAIEKSFANGNANGEQKLTKSQIAGKLADLMQAGDTSITESDVLRADTAGLVRPELIEKLGLNKQ